MMGMKKRMKRGGKAMKKRTKRMGGGMMKKRMKQGGKALKKVDAKKNPGLSKLPTEVRNKMGFMKRGGVAKQKMVIGGIARGINKLLSKKDKTSGQGKPAGKPALPKKPSNKGGGMDAKAKRSKRMGGGMMKKRMKRGGKAK